MEYNDQNINQYSDQKSNVNVVPASPEVTQPKIPPAIETPPAQQSARAKPTLTDVTTRTYNPAKADPLGTARKATASMPSMYGGGYTPQGPAKRPLTSGTTGKTLGVLGTAGNLFDMYQNGVSPGKIADTVATGLMATKIGAIPAAAYFGAKEVLPALSEAAVPDPLQPNEDFSTRFSKSLFGDFKPEEAGVTPQELSRDNLKASGLPAVEPTVAKPTGSNTKPENKADSTTPTMTPNIPNISPESFGAQLLGIGDMSKPQAFMPALDTLSYQNPQANQSATVSGLSKVAAPGVDVASIAEQFNAPDARYNIVPSAQTQAQQAGTGGQNGNAPMSDADLKLYGQFLDSDDAYSRSVVGLIQDQGMNVQQAMRYQDKLNAEARAMSANQAAPVDYKRDMQQVLLEAKKTGNPSIIAAAIQQQGQMRNAMLQDLRGTEQTDMRARTGIVQSEQQKLDRYEQAQAQQAQAQASAQQQALQSMFERQRMADEMALAQRGQQLKEVDTQARLWQMFNQKPQQQKLEYLDPSSFMSQPDSPYAQKGAFINPYTRELLPVLQGQQPTANNENTG